MPVTFPPNFAILCEKYPVLDHRYKLNSNKGYGTKAHIDGMWEYGITQWHRRTFGMCVNAPMNEIVDMVGDDTSAQDQNQK